MKKVKWNGLEDPGSDLHVCIRGAHYDVVRDEKTGTWSVIAPFIGRLPPFYTCNERIMAQVEAESLMRKLGVL